MSPFAFVTMSFDVRSFTAHAGHRYPVQVTLTGTTKTDGLRVVEEIILDGEAFAQLGRLYLEVSIRARIAQPCSRCATPAHSYVILHETFDVLIPPNAIAVDLYDPVLHLVLLAHDPNVLCRKDCQGLCPVCGADLNQNPDHVCSKTDDDRRTLKDLLS